MNRRQERLSRYYCGAQSREVVLGQTAAYDVGRPAAGAILATQDGEGLTLGLGVVEAVDRAEGSIRVGTPEVEVEDVMSVWFGAASWDLAGQRES